MVGKPVRLSAAAREWYLDEIRYLSERNKNAAMAFQELIKAARRNLSDFPKMGETGLIPGTRRLVVGNAYILTIRIRRDAVEIAAIRHGRMKDARAPDEIEAGNKTKR
jgi:toxin ParE1/3/4